MAKIKRIGDKKEITAKKVELTNWEKRLDKLANKSEKQLNTWFKKYFAHFPEEVRTGIETLVKVAWVNAKITKKLWEPKKISAVLRDKQTVSRN